MHETHALTPDAGPASETAPGGPAPASPPGPAPDVPGYDLGQLIGRGGMGDVWRARDRELDREVAVKVLQVRYPVESPAAARFVAEARITAQLQHPGVPAVYRVATLADGRPFLAMKLIKGQTLDGLIKSGAPVNTLAVIEAVAQALGYAHAHQVIHRDLKPANVMVGPFGEVQVMDWGLAKVVPARSEQGRTEHDPEATTAPTVIRTTLDADYTQQGSVLGTPAYMPPEQAGGETDRVGPASDVFGLGALWCKLLTGHPPFAGDDVEAVRRNAMRGKTEEALARLDACGAEPEVVALVKQCLAFEPGERPADGNEVARRVAALRVAAEERARQAELSRARAEVHAAEQARRRRVVLVAGGVVAGVLLAGLAASLWQMDRAIHAEGQARTNEDQANQNAETARQERDAKSRALEAELKARQQAYAALRSMTDDVIERRFAAGQGYTLTDEDRAFLRSVIAQYEAFAAIQGDDATSRAVRAEGRFRVGRMRHTLGELKEAEADYAAALLIRKQLAAEFPTRPEFRQDLAGSHTNRGAVLSVTGRQREAEADHDAALTIRKQLAAEFPTRPEFRQELARSHNNRGNLLQTTGRPKEAEADHDAALTIRKQLAAEFPNQPDLRSDLGGTCVNLALLHRQQKNWGEAKRLLLEGRPHHLAALKVSPRHPDYRQFYRNHLSVLTFVHAGLLEPEDAVRTADTIRDLGWDAPADAYDAAVRLSLCIPIVAKHDKLDDQQRQDAAAFYGDAAMRFLRDAVSKGYKDAARMKKVNALGPLRDREDFRKLLAELEAKGK